MPSRRSKYKTIIRARDLRAAGYASQRECDEALIASANYEEARYHRSQAMTMWDMADHLFARARHMSVSMNPNRRKGVNTLRGRDVGFGDRRQFLIYLNLCRNAVDEYSPPRLIVVNRIAGAMMRLDRKAAEDDPPDEKTRNRNGPFYQMLRTEKDFKLDADEADALLEMLQEQQIAVENDSEGPLDYIYEEDDEAAEDDLEEASDENESTNGYEDEAADQSDGDEEDAAGGK